MSWGPQARASYRCRKMAGRAAMLAYRKKNGEASSAPRHAPVARTAPVARPVACPLSISQPSSPQTPFSLEAEFLRDQRYSDGSQAVFIATLTPVLFVLLFVPMTSALAVFCTWLGILLVPEGAICFIYRAQMKASEKKLDADQQNNPEKYAAEQASRNMSKRLWDDFLARQDQQLGTFQQSEKLEQFSASPIPPAAPPIPPSVSHAASPLTLRAPSLPPGFKSIQQKQDEEATWLRQEMRWRSDAKQGKIATEEERMKALQYQEEKNRRERETAQRNTRMIQEKALAKQKEEDEKREIAALSAEVAQLWDQKKA